MFAQYENYEVSLYRSVRRLDSNGHFLDLKHDEIAEIVEKDRSMDSPDKLLLRQQVTNFSDMAAAAD